MSSLAPQDVAAFDRGLAAPGRLAVLFSATWCGPCRSFSPLLERVAEGIDDLALAKVDCDATPDLAARYGVRSVPTLVVLEKGEVTARQVGTLSEHALRRFLAAAP